MVSSIGRKWFSQNWIGDFILFAICSAFSRKLLHIHFVKEKKNHQATNSLMENFKSLFKGKGLIERKKNYTFAQQSRNSNFTPLGFGGKQTASSSVLHQMPQVVPSGSYLIKLFYDRKGQSAQ